MGKIHVQTFECQDHIGEVEWERRENVILNWLDPISHTRELYDLFVILIVILPRSCFL